MDFIGGTGPLGSCAQSAEGSKAADVQQANWQTRNELKLMRLVRIGMHQPLA